MFKKEKYVIALVVGGKEKDLFRIENLTKVYGRRYVFNNISFSIKSGEILGIIGKSGSGKTTFLNMLIGITKPEKGEILFRDMHLINSVEDGAMCSVFRNPQSLKKMFGFASQTPSFYPNLTALENLLYFGSLYNVPKKALLLNAESLLDLVDLSASKNLTANHMSGGMQRRLDIACSLIHDPKVLILDEPTSDLDPVLSNKIWEILRKVNAKGTSIIIVSHDLPELESICDRFVIFKGGKIVAQGSAEDIQKRTLAEETIYLHSSPGNYSKVMRSFSKEVAKSVKNINISGKMLSIDAVNAGKVIRELVGVLDQKNERIIEIELRKPSLDKIFVQIEQQGNKKIVAQRVMQDKKVKGKIKKSKKK